MQDSKNGPANYYKNQKRSINEMFEDIIKTLIFEYSRNTILAVGFIIIFILALGGALYYVITRRAASDIGLRLGTEPKTARRGDMLKVIMHTNPKKSVTISQIDLKLKCVKITKTDILGGSKIDVPKVIDTRVVSMEGQSLTAGEAKIIEGSIDIPSDGLVTNTYGNTPIRWYLEVTCIIGRSKAIEEVEIPVL